MIFPGQNVFGLTKLYKTHGRVRAKGEHLMQILILLDGINKIISFFTLSDRDESYIQK